MNSKQLKILAIDDTPANLALLGLALQDDYQIQIATSGGKGLELALDAPPDLILLDIMMPDMDGYETCRRIKANPLLKDIPIVFVTALNEIQAETLGFSLGAADYLTKPISIEIARLRIRNLLEREQFRQELQRREAEQRLAASVFAHTHDSVVITDSENRIIDANAAFSRITGYSREEVLGKNPSILKSGRQSTEFYKAMWQALNAHDHWSGELWNRNKKGEVFAALTSISVVRDDNGQIHHYIGLSADITPLKNHEYDLERIAHFDPLTGIPNRVLLADRLSQALAHTHRAGNHMAVCYLDLDGFKPVNDQFGHEVGDQLLIEISLRIRDCLRAGDTVARIGGDEFVLLLLDFNDTRECEAVLERMLCKVAEPLTIADNLVCVSASLGLTFYPDDRANADTLLRHADQAMYVAKQRGKNRYHRFDQELDRIALIRGETLTQIEAALINNQFVLYFQPKVNMRLGKVLGAEALIRWQHPERGLLSPAAFLPDIEGTEMVIALGNWVFARALDHLQNWQNMGLNIVISINIAPRHLLHHDFVETLRAGFAAHPQLRPHCLELEILETAALEDIGRVTAVMKECQKLGVGFALDDFGTGYSSLTYLKALPAETLKIDQSFIRDILGDPEDLAIVAGIINLTAAFHRQVIAEGVETEEHGLLLLKLGCDNAQGYGIARPMPAGDLPAWIANWLPNQEWLKKPALPSPSGTGPEQESPLE
ncbi:MULTISPECIES: EAL domain-containing protein [Methylomonas]|uniref:Diguanylate cyclase n=2 Tax=Methylomonas TaxID=416 RepID=A0A126T5Q3_9GAMM|nr:MULTISPECIES: EAL domain-containing protein [Methylomonas]AMK77413.1 diguanylate cyclase [Methylomonas denitrificans]OAI05005.1 diguanylate cyclase [Methylomonas methanica]TCV84547.1 PAS domain S-box-containing protein/diguanylate cyclase (GGDEF)-like protein [Methylomonas methanica]